MRSCLHQLNETVMKRSILILVLILAAFLSADHASAQNNSSAAQHDSTMLDVVIKNDGSQYIGRIISQDAREVLIETKTIGQVIIPKHEIKEIRKVRPGEISGSGNYVPQEVFSTRYFITANGLPIQKGESYILWNLYGPDFQFGVGKNFGLGIMTTWIGMPIVGTAKYSINLAEDLNLAVGTMLGTGSYMAPEFGLALPFTAITYGNRRSNINLSAGYGAMFMDGDAEGRFLLSVAGMSKIGRKLSVVFDSFLVPPGPYRTRYINQYDYATNTFIPVPVRERREAVALVIPGLRWQLESDKAFQFGFGGLYVDGEFMPVPLPMIQWYRKI